MKHINVDEEWPIEEEKKIYEVKFTKYLIILDFSNKILRYKKNTEDSLFKLTNEGRLE